MTIVFGLSSMSPRWCKSPRMRVTVSRDVVTPYNLFMQHHMLLALAMAIGAQAGAPPSAPGLGEVVARIHGRPVMRSEASTGSMLLGKVLGVLLEEFAMEQKVQVSQREIDASVARLEASMRRTREEWHQRLAKLEAEAAKSPTPQRKETIDREIR